MSVNLLILLLFFSFAGEDFLVSLVIPSFLFLLCHLMIISMGILRMSIPVLSPEN